MRVVLDTNVWVSGLLWRGTPWQIIRLVVIVDTAPVEPVIASDPNDDIFLACALAAGAQYLVSGDRHLLDLGRWRTVQIVTVNDFLTQHFPSE